jgi:hypothetical protein
MRAMSGHFERGDAEIGGVAPRAGAAPAATPVLEPGSPGSPTFVLVDRWTPTDAATVLLGTAMALVGVLALARTNLGEGWYGPVVEVLGARHTPLLGIAEAGAGALLALAGMSRVRSLAILIGLAAVVLGALAVVDAEVHRGLAIEAWWAWALAGWGLVVSVVALAPPRPDRVERVVETH